MSLESRLVALEAELVRMRRRSSRLRALAIVSLGTLALGATVQRGLPLVLRTKSLEIVDDAGRVVVRAAAADDGGTLSLFDRTGQMLAALSSENGGADLVLQNPAGRRVFRVASSTLGAEAHWFDAAGRETLAVVPTPQGALIEFRDRFGARTAELATGPNGGRFGLWGGDGSIVLAAEETQSQSLVSVGGSMAEPGIAFSSSPTGARVTLADGSSAADEGSAPGITLETSSGNASLFVGPKERAVVARSTGATAELVLLDRGSQALRAASREGDVGLWLQDGLGSSIFGVSSGEIEGPAAPPKRSDQAIPAGAPADPNAPSVEAQRALDRRGQLGATVKKPAPGEKLTPKDRLRLKAARDVFLEKTAERAGEAASQDAPKPAAGNRRSGPPPGRGPKYGSKNGPKPKPERTDG